MQLMIITYCNACGASIGIIRTDTAYIRGEELQQDVADMAERHRPHCPYYGRPLPRTA